MERSYLIAVAVSVASAAIVGMGGWVVTSLGKHWERDRDYQYRIEQLERKMHELSTAVPNMTALGLRSADHARRLTSLERLRSAEFEEWAIRRRRGIPSKYQAPGVKVGGER